MVRAYLVAVAGFTGLVIGFGVLSALVLLPAGLSAVLVLSVGVLTAAGYGQVRSALAEYGVRLGDRLRLVSAAVAVALAIAGLSAFFGPVVLAGVLVLGLCWLPLLNTDRWVGRSGSSAARRRGRRFGGCRGPTATAAASGREGAASAPVVGFDEYLLRPVVADWSDEQLCGAWRRSFTRLQHCDGFRSRAALVQVRRLYLDELAARHPGGFAAWLGAGARAASDPTRYLIPGHKTAPGAG